MNILEKLNKNKEIYRFGFSGSDDFSTDFGLSELFDNIDDIENYFKSKDGTIINKDDFIDYLYLKKFNMFSEAKDRILDQYKEKFNTCISLINQFYLKYNNKSSLIKYLQKDAINILETEKHNIRIEVFDLCFRYHTACQEVIRYIAKSKTYLIINNFDTVKDIILKYDDVCKELLDKNHFHEFKQFMLKNYFPMVKFFIDKQKHKQLTDEIIDEIINYSSEIFNSINDDNYLHYDILYSDICHFLKSIKRSEYVSLEENLSRFDDIKNSYFLKHGQEISFQIPIEELLSPFKNDKNSLQLKFHQLTHMYNKETRNVESIFTNIAHERKPRLIDAICATSMPIDDYFTISLQDDLRMMDCCYITCLQYFMCKERIGDLIAIMAAITQKICEYYKLDFKELELETDFNILLNMFNNLFYTNNNEFLVKGLCFSISMFEMALIEKVLRNIYIVLNDENYIKNDWASLGHLLNVDNQTMVNLLGLDNVKILSYYLIKCKDIGFNYRNNFAHYKNIKSDDFNYATTLKITQILICIINQLSLNVKE